jgi:hypothetical protein
MRPWISHWHGPVKTLSASVSDKAVCLDKPLNSFQPAAEVVSHALAAAERSCTPINSGSVRWMVECAIWSGTRSETGPSADGSTKVLTTRPDARAISLGYRLFVPL